MEGPPRDGGGETKTDVTFPDIEATRRAVMDVMNGHEQVLDCTPANGGTTLKEC